MAPLASGVVGRLGKAGSIPVQAPLDAHDMPSGRPTQSGIFRPTALANLLLKHAQMHSVRSSLIRD